MLAGMLHHHTARPVGCTITKARIFDIYNDTELKSATPNELLGLFGLSVHLADWLYFWFASKLLHVARLEISQPASQPFVVGQTGSLRALGR